MEKLQKIAFILSIALGVGGAAFAIFASTSPSTLMNNPAITALLPIVFIAFMVVIMLAAFSPLIKNAIDNAGKKKRLMQIGVKAVATIVGVQDTGITVNNNPFIKMEVEIKPGVHALISATVSRVGIPRPGDQVGILYDPAKPSDAILAS
ncbi:hypothetical protein IT413_06690 [Candidatus Peregrinibacteria bacterium]|nr:hypothetical protein [Candidatus Peregrinibacteria bacterium]